MMDFDLLRERHEIERKEDWRGWTQKLPKLRFRPDWDVLIPPPTGGALVRFLIFKHNNCVSVYFDAFSRLGVVHEQNEAGEWVDAPYYEVYAWSGEPKRYLITETDQMMRDIAEILG